MLSEEDKAKIKEGFCDEPNQIVEDDKEIRILVAGTCDIPVSLADLIFLKQFGRNVLVEADSDYVSGEHSEIPNNLLLIRIIK